MSKDEQKCKNFIKIGVQISPNTSDGKIMYTLPPGCYDLKYSRQTDETWVEKLDIKNDKIIDIPTPEYSALVKRIETFLKPEIRQKFKDMDFIYKNSVLLHGKPGTGKTLLINKISNEIISRGGVVIWAQGAPRSVATILSALTDLQPETLVGVIFEEFDDLIKHSESELLTLLDGQVQKDNIMFLATTNFIDKIPPRIRRPGRFASIIEVKEPGIEARKHYIAAKMGQDFVDLQMWSDETEGLTIDEIKAVVQATGIMGEPLNCVIARLKDAPIDEADLEKDVEEDSNEWGEPIISRSRKR